MTRIGAAAALGPAVSDDPIDQLSDEAIDRYARQLVLPEMGARGQIDLGEAKVAVIGCGGLGANAALALAQAGIGKLELYDPDKVEVSNLHRQPFRLDQVGQPKAQALVDLCQERNPEVDLKPTVRTFQSSLAPIWLDCTDSDPSRREIDALRTADTHLVFGSVIAMDAQVTVFEAGVPGFSALFPGAPDADMRMSCAEQGVLGPLAIMTAQIMAAEALKLAMGQSSALREQLLMIDARDWRQTLIKRPQV